MGLTVPGNRLWDGIKSIPAMGNEAESFDKRIPEGGNALKGGGTAIPVRGNHKRNQRYPYPALCEFVRSMAKTIPACV